MFIFITFKVFFNELVGSLYRPILVCTNLIYTIFSQVHTGQVVHGGEVFAEGKSEPETQVSVPECGDLAAPGLRGLALLPQGRVQGLVQDVGA
jgi:hypothetical protein